MLRFLRKNHEDKSIRSIPKATLSEMAAIFDAPFYLDTNPDVAASGIDPLEHYLTAGWREGRDPRAGFSTRYYLDTHGTGGMNPLFHWVTKGRDQGLATKPEAKGEAAGKLDPVDMDPETEAALREAFDEAYYLIRNVDVANSGDDPLWHYLQHGWLEGRDPNPGFSSNFYVQTHDTGGLCPLLHWVRFGREKGLATAPDSSTGKDEIAGFSGEELARLQAAFSEEYYRDHNPDVVEAGVDPFTHYMVEGWRERRDPTPDFSTAYYLERYRDIADANINPFAHFILYGQDEGRSGTDPERYESAWDYASSALNLSIEDFILIESYFDNDYYAQNNQDVAESSVDPLLHYLVSGWREGRDPCADFSGNYYLETNPDIDNAGLNPFVHWVLHGRAEGRHGRAASVGDKPLVPSPSEIDWSACPTEDVDDIASRFDKDFYLTQYPDVTKLGVDPKVHYLMLGWRLGYDPRADFSTRYYCDRYVDIQQAGVNPFLHFCRHGHRERRETRSYIEMRRPGFRPKVSVILPNYNHARYLPQRIRSIAEQTYDNLEIIILDDKSPDNSCEVIRRTVAELGIEARLEINDVNSGNPFAQWRKGLSMAKGDLIWICESDDFCEPDFLEHLIPAFADDSVNIAFGRIQFCDAEDNFMPGLDGYREGAEAGIWEETLTRPVAEWCNGGFGVNNVIANVGGCVMRRVDLPEHVWDEARTFKICGDWFLYLHIAAAGQITFEPRSVAYFRQHGLNTSARNFHQRYYYDELIRILKVLSEQWGVSKQNRLRFLDKVKAQYKHFGLPETMGDFDETFGVPELLATERTSLHIQVFFLGFYPGGGELFPINLANAFLAAGHTVSMVAVDMMSINEDMRGRLDRRIAVYHASHLTSRGRETFLKAAGVSIVNSHVASADAFLFTLGEQAMECPYVVTLHGSYVAFEEAPQKMIDWVIGNVNGWIYTADRNLEFFENHEVDWDDFVKLPNAMPRDNRAAGFTRKELGISDQDTVFTLIARGIKRKGWRASVEAFTMLREEYGRSRVKLLLVGDGEEAEQAKLLARGIEGIHFLGYQSEINGILRLSDALILPSRFEGESYPLCLIQAIQEHLPAIATDIGEIKSMMTGGEGHACGILLENQRDSRAFFAELAKAMDRMCDPDTRAVFKQISEARARDFDMKSLVKSYQGVYRAAQKIHRTVPILD